MIKCISCNKILDSNDLDFGNPESMCEACYYYDQQVEAWKDENRMIQITRDMAIDGGCPEREGEWIQW